MENQKRDWKIANYSGASKRNSEEVIQYFQTSNKYLVEKNEYSENKIAALDLEIKTLLEEFEKNNGISFEEAKNYKDNAWHYDRDFNLEEFDKLEKLIEKLEGEKFFIYQRNKLKTKNDEVIKDIQDWIKNNSK